MINSVILIHAIWLISMQSTQLWFIIFFLWDIIIKTLNPTLMYETDASNVSDFT